MDAALKGCFSDFKLIKTRSVAQLVIEVPLEAADHALKVLGGVPQHGSERWVAVARLDEKAVEKPEDKPRREFSSLPLSQQAALACQDGRFQRFLIEHAGFEAIDTDGAAEFVRRHCNIDSRAELDKHIVPRERWQELYSEYQAWLQV